MKLKTEAWRDQLEEELALCGDTTVPLIEETLNISDQVDTSFSIRNIEGKSCTLFKCFYLDILFFAMPVPQNVLLKVKVFCCHPQSSV